MNGEQQRQRHLALGGGGLIGDAYERVAKAGKSPGSLSSPGNQPDVGDAERRLGRTGDGIGDPLVENAVAIDEGSRSQALADVLPASNALPGGGRMSALPMRPTGRYKDQRPTP